jgi:2-oxoglutarate ferredoxin oxidoreductase subunit alpha
MEPKKIVPYWEKDRKQPIVNEFAMAIATINGSGSATANNILLRTLFRMGIPVSGKNIFPSNIQGLPTWYTIRASAEGFVGRSEVDDILVAMNPASIVDDIHRLAPNGVLYYSNDITVPIERKDITVYPMPVKALSRTADVAPGLREYVANMVYVGILAVSMSIDLNILKQTLSDHFHGNEKAVNSNYGVVAAAAEWAKANLKKNDHFRVEKIDQTRGCIMTDGNAAGALGAMFGGVQFVAWYPITPASSLAEALNENLPRTRACPKTGKDTFAVVQAEDELAAVGMAIGAGWSGLRAMTSTSGAGISLMGEYAGLAYYAEVPIVIWNVQRVGPSTGLPTRTSQGDLTQAYFLSQGDTRFIILIPGSVNECFEFGWKAFDIAEHYQTPVFVLSDLDLGMNQWMTPEFVYPDKPFDRGKILWEEDLEKIKETWGRYKDLDGDGIPYRTVPGNKHPNAAWFARGTGHDEYANYSEDPEVWEKMLKRVSDKVLSSREALPAPVVDNMPGARFGIITMGSAEPAVNEARAILAQEGTPTDLMRIRALPLAASVKEFIQAHLRNYVVELNQDGQLRQLITLETDCVETLISVAHTDGMPLSAKWIYEQLTAREAKSHD